MHTNALHTYIYTHSHPTHTPSLSQNSIASSKVMLTKSITMNVPQQMNPLMKITGSLLVFIKKYDMILNHLTFHK